MPKPIIGVILGAAVGFIDGLTSIFTPESEHFLEIGVWSGAKGLIVGLIIGFYARKIDSLSKVIIFGVIVLSFLTALANYLEVGVHYWVEIMLPGTITGAIVGYGTQKLGKQAN